MKDFEDLYNGNHVSCVTADDDGGDGIDYIDDEELPFKQALIIGWTDLMKTSCYGLTQYDDVTKTCE